MRQPGDPIPEPNVHLRIPGQWDDPVYFDRVPVAGDRLEGPEGFGIFNVIEVIWEFSGGFAFPPVPIVIARAL